MARGTASATLGGVSMKHLSLVTVSWFWAVGTGEKWDREQG
jgi:hypothetical protein